MILNLSMMPCVGFGHDAGPFETLDLLGVKEALDCMDQAGYPAAEW